MSTRDGWYFRGTCGEIRGIAALVLCENMSGLLYYATMWQWEERNCERSRNSLSQLYR